jgi:hypothetical protein
MLTTLVLALLLAAPALAGAADLPIFDAHLHYSHDAWGVVPPADAVALMRRAGLVRALVSSSNDEGTQKLLAAAPDLVVPELRPYRTRGDVSGWVRDEGVVAYLEERLRAHRYVAIGEFHLYGADAELPVPRRLVALARQHGLMLHAHSDADAVERLFRQWPQARVLWAHAGFEPPPAVRAMLRRHANLWADLAYRTDHAPGGRLAPEWRALFLEFPDRFMVGTDSFVPERWHYVPEHAAWARGWLAELPAEVAERIAWKNGEAVIGAAFGPPAARAAEPCPAPPAFAPAGRIESGDLVVVFRTVPATIEIGRHFSVDAVVCVKPAGPAVRSLRIDAEMPEHRHGMNYTARVAAAGEGRYTAEGFLFHMPGRWRLVFDVERGGRTDRLATELLVE